MNSQAAPRFWKLYYQVAQERPTPGKQCEYGLLTCLESWIYWECIESVLCRELALSFVNAAMEFGIAPVLSPLGGKMMANVEVTIITPDGREYATEVDEDTDGESLLSTLVEQISLPRVTKDGTNVEYRLSVVGDLRIREGATIKVERVAPPPVMGDLSSTTQRMTRSSHTINIRNLTFDHPCIILRTPTSSTIGGLVSLSSLRGEKIMERSKAETIFAGRSEPGIALSAEEYRQVMGLARSIVRGEIHPGDMETIGRLAPQVNAMVQYLFELQDSPAMRRLREENPYFESSGSSIVRDRE